MILQSKDKVRLDNRTYQVTVQQNITSTPDVPRLIIPAFMPNDTAKDILRVCIQSIQQHTDHPYELWVVDNYSPDGNGRWLLDEPDINVVLNHTIPIPPDERIWKHWLKPPRHLLYKWGSYNNAIGIELARAFIPQTSHWVMTLHMDTMVTENHWLDFLLSKCNEIVRASGVRMDTARTREGILHVLGFIVDYQLFQELGLNYFPDLPQYDVGDLVTFKIRQAGYNFVACRNSHWQPELIDLLPPDSPYRNLGVDRVLDDNNHVIFLHLGRGVRKSDGTHLKGTSPEEWIEFAEQHILGKS